MNYLDEIRLNNGQNMKRAWNFKRSIKRQCLGQTKGECWNQVSTQNRAPTLNYDEMEMPTDTALRHEIQSESEEKKKMTNQFACPLAIFKIFIRAKS